jgi:hypothetical protein
MIYTLAAEVETLLSPSLLKDWGTAGIIIAVLVFGAIYILPRLVIIGKDFNQASERLASVLGRAEVVVRRAEEMYPAPKIKTKYQDGDPRGVTES